MSVRLRANRLHLVDLPKPEDLSPISANQSADEVRIAGPIRPVAESPQSGLETIPRPGGMSPGDPGYEAAMSALSSSAKRLSVLGQAPPQVTRMMQSVLSLVSLRDSVKLQRGRGGQV